MAHTPGPWEWDGHFTVSIPHTNGTTAFRTNQEDARLIAAAPDLLEACQEASRLLDEEAAALQAKGLSSGAAHLLWLKDKLDAALAKAQPEA